jgi:hypothetical protein
MMVNQALSESHQHLLNINAMNDLSPKELQAFAMLNSSYHQRLIRLHRPYLLRSYNDPKYEECRLIALSSARQIVTIHCKLLKQESTSSQSTSTTIIIVFLENAIFLFIHHISALLLLFVHQSNTKDQRGEVSDLLNKSTEAFQSVMIQNTRRAQEAARGYRITTEMLEVTPALIN